MSGLPAGCHQTTLADDTRYHFIVDKSGYLMGYSALFPGIPAGKIKIKVHNILIYFT